MDWTHSMGGGELIGSVVLIVSLAGAVGLLWREVTRRRRTEAELSRFAVTLDTTPDAIIGAKIDGTIFGWNRAAERIYGSLAKSENVIIVPADSGTFDNLTDDAVLAKLLGREIAGR